MFSLRLVMLVVMLVVQLSLGRMFVELLPAWLCSKYLQVV